MNSIKILIANKYFLMNYAIRCILQGIEGFEVYGFSETEIMDEIVKLKPDILIIEIEMIKGNSCEFILEVKKRFPKLKIIVLLDIENENKLLDLIQLQLNAYLVKNISKDELIYAATCVYKGEKYFSGEINQYLVNNFIDPNGNLQKKENEESLSEREKEVLHLIVSGEKNREIAGRLYISENTVLTHRRNIMRKLKTRNTAQLITTSVKRGIVNI